MQVRSPVEEKHLQSQFGSRSCSDADPPEAPPWGQGGARSPLSPAGGDPLRVEREERGSRACGPCGPGPAGISPSLSEALLFLGLSFLICKMQLFTA